MHPLPIMCCSAILCLGAASAADLVYADHTAGSPTALPEELISQIKAKAVAIAFPPQSKALVDGLAELGKQDQRFALRSAANPGKSWYDEGGVGTYATGGYNKITARLDAFSGKLQRELVQAIAVAQVQADANDLPSGRRIESGYTQYSATMDIRFTSTTLQGIFVEEILAYRRIGNILLFPPVSYPLELPNFQVDHTSLTTRIPVGLATPEAGAMQQGGSGNGLAANAWPRDPRVAFAAYRDTMERLEQSQPGTTFVWTTMPLATSDNMQRSWFNMQVRQYAVAKNKPVFDLAALQSHKADGSIAYDDQGEVLAKEWAEPSTPTSMNAAGRARVAGAWWWMMARLQGWKGPAQDGAGASVTGLSGS